MCDTLACINVKRDFPLIKRRFVWTLKVGIICRTAQFHKFLTSACVFCSHFPAFTRIYLASPQKSDSQLGSI